MQRRIELAERRAQGTSTHHSPSPMVSQPIVGPSGKKQADVSTYRPDHLMGAILRDSRPRPDYTSTSWAYGRPVKTEEVHSLHSTSTLAERCAEAAAAAAAAAAACDQSQASSARGSVRDRAQGRPSSEAGSRRGSLPSVPRDEVSCSRSDRSVTPRQGRSTSTDRSPRSWKGSMTERPMSRHFDAGNDGGRRAQPFGNNTVDGLSNNYGSRMHICTSQGNLASTAPAQVGRTLPSEFLQPAGIDPRRPAAAWGGPMTSRRDLRLDSDRASNCGASHAGSKTTRASGSGFDGGVSQKDFESEIASRSSASSRALLPPPPSTLGDEPLELFVSHDTERRVRGLDTQRTPRAAGVPRASSTGCVASRRPQATPPGHQDYYFTRRGSGVAGALDWRR